MDYTKDRDRILELLRENLSDEKYAHSLETEKRAIHLAEIHGEDTEKAGFAGLIHDITKCMNNDELAERYGIGPTVSHKTMHQLTGAEYIKEHHITADEDIIEAVRTHTTGATGMTKLQKIIYLADATEPGRHFYYVNELRKASEKDLDEAMLMSLESTVNNLKKRDLPIDENTNLAYNEIKELVDRK